MKEKESMNKMGTVPVNKLMLSMGIPMILSMMLQAAYNIVDSAFVSNMANALSAANLVVSRAGAGSISEFALLGKAVILVPSPNVSEDHQTKNAMALVDKGAAIYVADAKAKEELVKRAIEVVCDDAKIASLEENILSFGRPNAAEDIAEEVLMLADAYIEKETRRQKENLK